MVLILSILMCLIQLYVPNTVGQFIYAQNANKAIGLLTNIDNLRSIVISIYYKSQLFNQIVLYKVISNDHRYSFNVHNRECVFFVPFSFKHDSNKRANKLPRRCVEKLVRTVNSEWEW